MTIARVLAQRAPAHSVVTARAGEPARACIARLAEHRIGAVPVLDEQGGVIGIFSERDVIYRLVAEGAALLDRPVGEVMTSPAISVDTATGVLEALGLMTRRRIRHLPVIEGGELVGFVSIGDLVKHRMDSIADEAQAMMSYIQSA